jgi:hypothetical protein
MRVLLSQPPVDVDDRHSLHRYLAEIRTALNGPSFRVHRNGVNQVGVASGAVTKIEFNSIANNGASIEGWDTHEYFDLVTNFRYTPKIAGIYLFGIQAIFATFTLAATLSILIRKNGFTMATISASSAIASSPSVEVVTPVFMNGSTDFVEFFVFQNTGAPLDIASLVQNTNAWGQRLPNFGI